MARHDAGALNMPRSANSALSRVKQKAAVKAYIREAIAVEKSGAKAQLKPWIKTTLPPFKS